MDGNLGRGPRIDADTGAGVGGAGGEVRAPKAVGLCGPLPASVAIGRLFVPVSPAQGPVPPGIAERHTGAFL